MLVPDWRGHGESAEPRGDFGSAQLVEDALAVIRASGAQQIVPVALGSALCKDAGTSAARLRSAGRRP